MPGKGLSAKLTPPTLPKIVQRPRLLRELDRARKRPIVWITAPPGAGKTTLVASYLKARTLPCLWYQVDEGDADPATLFYYLRVAGEQRGRRHKHPLSLFTPEYRPGLSVYSKRFFESLCARLKAPAALVFDNVQLIPAAAEVHAALAAAFELLPPGITVFILSRQPPPPAMASLQAQQRIASLAEEHLRLTESEARQVVQLHRGPRVTSHDQLEINRWHQQTRGWLAGLILLLNSGNRGGRGDVFSTMQTPQVLFEYLAQEAFGQLAPDIQHVLWTTAFAPYVTEEMAVALSGIADAGTHLHCLARGGYFTERRTGPTPSYQYHPLWRSFLQHHGRGIADPSMVQAVQQHTATLLEDAGQFDTAIELSLEAKEWTRAALLLMTHAPILMQEGRVESLARWIQALPPAVRDETPWLQFWLGSCFTALNPQKAPRLLEQVAMQFERAGDQAGQMLTLSVLIEMTTYSGRDWRPVDTWIDTILRLTHLRLTQQGTQFPSAEIECRVTFALTNAMVIVGWGTEAETWCGESLRLLQTSHGKAAISHIGHTLMLWLLFTGRQQEASSLLAELDHERQKSPDNPLTEIRYLSSFCLWAWRVGQPVEACDAAAHGLALGETSGLYQFATPLQVFGSYAALSMRDRPRWEDFAKRLPGLLDKCPSMVIQSHAIRLQAGFALLDGDMSRARQLLIQAQSSFHGKGYKEVFEMLWVPPLRHLQYRAGRHAEMETEWLDSTTWWQHPLARLDTWHHCLVLTCIHKARGCHDEALHSLREGLRIGRECQFFVLDWPMEEEVATCCAMALEEGIEVDYVRELIRRLKIEPPEQARASTTWPWAIRVQTLG